MKILLLSSAPAVSGTRTGGSIIWCQSFVRMLRKRGHEVFLVTYGEKYSPDECPEFKNITAFGSYDRTRLAWIDPVLFKHIPGMIKTSKVVSDITRKKNIDIVVTSNIHEAGCLFFSKITCPIITICHGYYPYELRNWNDGRRRWPRLTAYWLLEQCGARRAVNIVCPSHWLKERLTERLPHHQGIKVIHNMLGERPVMRHGYSRKALSLRENTPLIVSYNIMTAPFNSEALAIYLNSVKKVAMINDQIQFLLFGVNDSAMKFVLQSARGLPITILGKVDNVFEVLELADIFLHVSLADTFSMTTLEAMSLGLPVIVTDLGALRERVGDNENGLVVDLDPGKISEAVITLVNNPNKGKVLGGNAAMSSADYREDKIAKQWEEFLIQTIEKGAF